MNNNYILGSHNSWTFLPPRLWWMKLIKWTARCQNKSISEQYKAGVRCFDLRLKQDTSGQLCIVHGLVKYQITKEELYAQLSILDGYGDVSINVLHDIRKKSEQTDTEVKFFQDECYELEETFPHIEFFSGRNLVDWCIDYAFKSPGKSIENAYASVRKRNTIFALFPILYAWLYNDKELEHGTEEDVLFLDFI